MASKRGNGYNIQQTLSGANENIENTARLWYQPTKMRLTNCAQPRRRTKRNL